MKKLVFILLISCMAFMGCKNNKEPIESTQDVDMSQKTDMPEENNTSENDNQKEKENNDNAVESPAYTSISQEEAKKIMDEGNVIILDVRTEDEYLDSHIVDAILLPVDEIDDKAETVLPDKEAVILVYCRSGNRSKKASKLLAEKGYKNIYEFGGITTWQYEVTDSSNDTQDEGSKENTIHLVDIIQCMEKSYFSNIKEDRYSGYAELLYYDNGFFHIQDINDPNGNLLKSTLKNEVRFDRGCLISDWSKMAQVPLNDVLTNVSHQGRYINRYNEIRDISYLIENKERLSEYLEYDYEDQIITYVTDDGLYYQINGQDPILITSDKVNNVNLIEASVYYNNETKGNKLYIYKNGEIQQPVDSDYVAYTTLDGVLYLIDSSSNSIYKLTPMGLVLIQNQIEEQMITYDDGYIYYVKKVNKVPLLFRVNNETTYPEFVKAMSAYDVDFIFAFDNKIFVGDHERISDTILLFEADKEINQTSGTVVYEDEKAAIFYMTLAAYEEPPTMGLVLDKENNTVKNIIGGFDSYSCVKQDQYIYYLDYNLQQVSRINTVDMTIEKVYDLKYKTNEYDELYNFFIDGDYLISCYRGNNLVEKYNMITHKEENEFDLDSRKPLSYKNDQLYYSDDKELFKINILTNEHVKLFDNEVKNIVVIKDKIFFTTQERDMVYILDVETDECKEFYDISDYSISFVNLTSDKGNSLNINIATKNDEHVMIEYNLNRYGNEYDISDEDFMNLYTEGYNVASGALYDAFYLGEITQLEDGTGVYVIKGIHSFEELYDHFNLYFSKQISDSLVEWCRSSSFFEEDGKLYQHFGGIGMDISWGSPEIVSRKRITNDIIQYELKVSDMDGSFEIPFQVIYEAENGWRLNNGFPRP